MGFLIVEDDPKIAAFIRDGLRQEGHDVAAAADGEAALACVAQSTVPLDALVLDLMRPRLDGFDVLRSLRAGGVGSPVLMLSALDSVDDRVRGLRAGADDYLVKPFAFDESTARLLALTRRAHPVSGTPPGQAVLALSDLSMDRLHRRVRRGPRGNGAPAGRRSLRWRRAIRAGGWKCGASTGSGRRSQSPCPRTGTLWPERVEDVTGGLKSGQK